jgi:hypothetical protein
MAETKGRVPLLLLSLSCDITEFGYRQGLE